MLDHRLFRILARIGWVFLWAASAGAQTSDVSVDKVGVLIMAHGGSPEWNEAVARAAASLESFCPVEIAFGMAQRESLRDAIARLGEKGVGRAAVVRLFVSAESFRVQTEYLLGLRPDPPPYYLVHGQSHSSGHGPHAAPPRVVSSRDLWIPPIEAGVSLSLSREGLYDSPAMGQIMIERVLALSRQPEKESVLVLAHGEGDDALNAQWMSRLEQLAVEIGKAGPFREVRAETLREDWAQKRAESERRIREFVARESRRGRVIVVPFRVFGFGPYRQTLEGLDYEADGLGLLPHRLVGEWIREQAEKCIRREGWPNPFAEPAAAGM